VTDAHEGSIDERLAAAGLPPLPRGAGLEVDLDALAGNLAALRTLADGAPMYPVVKADAYGHGAVPVAIALEGAGADGLCVATIDEALALRNGGVRGPIRVLYPIPPAYAADAARRRISVAAGDRETLRRLLEAATAAGVGVRGEARLGVELEVETGLGRGGATPDVIAAMARSIRASTAAALVGLWTHLQASEDPSITARQLERFDAASIAVGAAGLELPPRHVASSGGLLTDVAAFDGVRPGLSVYGIVPDELAGRTMPGAVDAAAGLRPVMSLHARPVRVADLPAGHGISYGPTFTTSRPSRIATLPLGYGDGYARANSNRASALVRGSRVPLVGNVAMDGLMVDVTDVPGPPVDLDDEFVLLGSQGGDRIRAEDLALTRTTNTWEVVTQMSGRLPRVYHAAAGAVGLRTLAGWSGAIGTHRTLER
jgi:alanine racemase